MPLKRDSSKIVMQEMKTDGIIEALFSGKGSVKIERFQEESLDIDLTACSAIPVVSSSKCSSTIFDCFESESWQRFDDLLYYKDEEPLEVKRNKRKSTLPKRADQGQDEACCSSVSETSKRKHILADGLSLVMEPQPISPLLMDDEISEPRSDHDNDSAGEMIEYIPTEIPKQKPDIIYNCHCCRSTFSVRSHFENHYRSSHNETLVLYTCLKCDKRFDKYKTFRAHWLRHANSDRHKCDICSKGFQHKSSLRLHTATHSKSIQCVHCDSGLPSVKEYKSHLRREHPDSEDANKKATTTTIKKTGGECPICGKMLMTNSSLSMHLKIHQDNPRFQCEECGQKFVQKINLIHHIKKHTGERPFICDLCNKSFIERSHLLRHKNYHLHVRQFKCDKCGKNYKTERCLKVHSLIHTESRPHVCEQCNKGFLSSSKLKQHYNIHTGARPFKCKYCIKDFTNFPNWLKHIRRRHKVDHRTGEQLEKMPEFLLRGRKKVGDSKKEVISSEAIDPKVLVTNDVKKTKEKKPSRRKLKENKVLTPKLQDNEEIANLKLNNNAGIQQNNDSKIGAVIIEKKSIDASSDVLLSSEPTVVKSDKKAIIIPLIPPNQKEVSQVFKKVGTSQLIQPNQTIQTFKNADVNRMIQPNQKEGMSIFKKVDINQVLMEASKQSVPDYSNSKVMVQQVITFNDSIHSNATQLIKMVNPSNIQPTVEVNHPLSYPSVNNFYCKKMPSENQLKSLRLDFQQILHENEQTNVTQTQLVSTASSHSTNPQFLNFQIALPSDISLVPFQQHTDTIQQQQQILQKSLELQGNKIETPAVPKKRKVSNKIQNPKEPKQKKINKTKLLQPKLEPIDVVDKLPASNTSPFHGDELVPKFENIDESTLPLFTSEDVERATNIIMEQALAMEDDGLKCAFKFEPDSQPDEMFDCGNFRIIHPCDDVGQQSYMDYDQTPLAYTSDILQPIEPNQSSSDPMSITFMQPGMLFGENSGHLLGGRFSFDDNGILPN